MRPFLTTAGLAVAFALSPGAWAGPSATDVRVDGMSLTIIADGLELTGPRLSGVTMAVSDDRGKSLVIRFEAAEPYAVDGAWAYRIRMHDGANGRWVEICEPDSAGKRLGFTVAGRFDVDGSYVPDSDRFFLACTSGAVAKCLTLGYLPWKSHSDGTRLRDYFTACTRMIRADYCGDGAGHTRNGTPINIFDRLGIQRRDEAPGMVFEAAWSAAGARCVAKTRLADLLTLDRLTYTCGARLTGKLGRDCGFEDAVAMSDALIFNESAP